MLLVPPNVILHLKFNTILRRGSERGLTKLNAENWSECLLLVKKRRVCNSDKGDLRSATFPDSLETG